MSLRTILSNYGFAFQRELFPTLEEELGFPIVMEQFWLLRHPAARSPQRS